MVSTSDSWADGLVQHNPLPAFDAARELAPDARVLFVGEARGFLFPRTFVAPSPYDVSPLVEPLETLGSATAAADWLVDRGYTHLLVGFGELNRLAPSYPVAPWRTPAGRERFEQLLRLSSPAVIMVDDVGIFELPPTAGRDRGER